MAIEITGRHIEIPARDKTWIQERAARLERHTGKITEGRLIVTGEKHRVIAEVTITARRRNWEAHAASTDLAGALAAVFDRLETQAQSSSNLGRTGRADLADRHIGVDAVVGEVRAARVEFVPVEVVPELEDECAVGVGSRVGHARNLLVF